MVLTTDGTEDALRYLAIVCTRKKLLESRVGVCVQCDVLIGLCLKH